MSESSIEKYPEEYRTALMAAFNGPVVLECTSAQEFHSLRRTLNLYKNLLIQHEPDLAPVLRSLSIYKTPTEDNEWVMTIREYDLGVNVIKSALSKLNTGEY